MPNNLKTTPLDGLHRALGARMVPFAGYAMPVQYDLTGKLAARCRGGKLDARCRGGVLAEHLHCRTQAALFDVSHMGQAQLAGPGCAAALEALVPGDIAGLKPGRQRYTLLTNEQGGILDDLMVANLGDDHLALVVNAACKDADFAHIAAAMPAGVRLTVQPDRGLLALQGPMAAGVLARLSPGIGTMAFMAVASVPVAGIECLVSRSGYSGEDGFEISVPARQAEDLAWLLLAEPEVAPAGLGARDTLRLEAGLCLYGNDIDATTNPVEAALTWTISKRRKMAWDFPGAAPIRQALHDGPARLRVGIRPDGRAPARAGTEIVDLAGAAVGRVTSGGFGPSLNAPLAMGYVRADLAVDGTPIALMVRGKALPARIAPMPFVPHRYVR